MNETKNNGNQIQIHGTRVHASSSRARSKRARNTALALTTLILFCDLNCARFTSAPKVSAADSASAGSTAVGSLPFDNDANAFDKGVGQLIVTSRAGCHASQNGIGPFPLETYDQIKAMGAAVRDAVANRRMPPPGADNSGSCQKFESDHWLQTAEIQKITDWVDAGMPKGSPDYRPTLPTHVGLSNPDHIIKMPDPYTPKPPAGKIDDYRCFVVDPGATTNTLVSAIEVRPDKAQVVHHVIIFKPTSAQAESQAISMEGTDGAPGYSCFGAAGVASSLMGIWAPGARSGEMVDPNTGQVLGFPLEAGRKLIMQVHYNTANGAMTDQSSFAIKFNAAAKPVQWLLLADIKLSLPAGQASIDQTVKLSNSLVQIFTNAYESGAVNLSGSETSGSGSGIGANPSQLLGAVSSAPPARDMTVYAMGPHMHTLGRSLDVHKIDTAGADTCMINVPKFDFNWQGGYQFSKPLTFGAKDQFNLKCNFDTSTRTTTTSFGESTMDEMCLAFILVNK